MQIIQMRLLVVQDEELGAIRIRPFIRHAQHTALVVDIVGMELVGKWHWSPNTLATLDARLVLGAATLDHETANVAMKVGIVIGTRCAKGEKIKRRAWTSVAVNLQLEIAQRCVQRDRHDSMMMTCCFELKSIH